MLNIITETTEGNIKGAKSFTINAGCHVPLIISWPKFMKKGRIYESLIEFSDFFPTLMEVAGVSVDDKDIDGKSFLSVLKGSSVTTRETAFVHYDPQWYKTSLNRNRFAQTLNYKLYRDKRFFNISIDPLELNPIDNLTNEEDLVMTDLQNILDKAEQESPWMETR